MTDITPHASTDPRPILVIGGTGKTGRRVAEGLAARGVPVRLGSRSGTPPFSWEDSATWGPALAGTRAAYLFVPDLILPGAADTVDAVAAVAKEAREAGVEHLVLLSGRGEEVAELSEQALQDSGVPWTVVRCAFFAQNFSEGYLLDAVLEGTVAFPGGDTAEPFVDLDDVAAVAVAALTEPGHAGRVYELTGPELLTWADAAAEIAAASGREVGYQPVGVDDYTAVMREEGYPEHLVETLAEVFAVLLDGHNAYVTDGVRQALGRPPRSFAEFARAAAAGGAWA
jgi:uncharacterized protein YbjT (DUF2867 family)